MSYSPKSSPESAATTSNTLPPNFEVFISPPIASGNGSQAASLTGKDEVSVAGGKKFDSGKDRWDLLPIESMRQIAKVLGYGAKKYGDNNWQNVPDARRRYYAALMRHMTSWYEGELKDPETGISHLAHAGASLVFLIWLEANNKLEGINNGKT